MKLAYGTDEENLNASGEFNSFEEAFEEAITECDAEAGQTIYVCEVHPYKPKPSASLLIEQVNETAWDNCGEAVDCWPDHTKEEAKSLQEKLNKVFEEWLVEIKQDDPRFWTCGKSKSFVVTNEHIAELVK